MSSGTSVLSHSPYVYDVRSLKRDFVRLHHFNQIEEYLTIRPSIHTPKHLPPRTRCRWHQVPWDESTGLHSYRARSPISLRSSFWRITALPSIRYNAHMVTPLTPSLS